MIRFATILSALVMLLAGCGEQAPPAKAKADSGVRGVVLTGPQCPVETVENPCPHLPVSGIVVTVSSPDGSLAAETRTDSEGRFRVAVPPGEYLLRPIVEGGGVTFAKPVHASVSVGRFVAVTVQVDTGIR